MAELALACVHREYPNNILHLLRSGNDVKAPSALTPAFYGCFDWHSAVHGHWLLARLTLAHPSAVYAERGKAALERSCNPDSVRRELQYLAARPAFERPYGIAWLLMLVAELDDAVDADAQRWRGLLAPLEEHAANVFFSWLPELANPIRAGTHAQTAFALTLVHDWARTVDNQAMLELLGERCRTFYGNDVDCPCDYEPSGHDFFSPCLAESDLMRRVLPNHEFVAWFDRFLPDPAFEPVAVTNREDGHLVHLDGLNLSRAWMMRGTAAALGESHRHFSLLRSSAERHAEAGLEGLNEPTYAGGHWLGTFAAYLLTERGRGATESRTKSPSTQRPE